MVEVSYRLGLRERKAASKADSRPAMVMPQPGRVHVEGAVTGRRPPFPQGSRPVPDNTSRWQLQSWGSNCAQTAIIPTNSTIDASAAASSTKTFNISPSCHVNIEGTLSRFCSLVKWRLWVSLENAPKKEIGWLMQNLRFRIVAAGWLKWSLRRRGLT